MQVNPKKLILVGSLAVTVLVAGLTGCKSHERSAGRRMDDRSLARHVRHGLDDEQVYKFPDVRVDTFDGIVQLSGFVATEGQKQRAGQIAQQVQGASQVVNSITLKPEGNLSPTGQPTGQPHYDATTQLHTNSP